MITGITVPANSAAQMRSVIRRRRPDANAPIYLRARRVTDDHRLRERLDAVMNGDGLDARRRMLE
jgi:hypothetical protein